MVFADNTSMEPIVENIWERRGVDRRFGAGVGSYWALGFSSGAGLRQPFLDSAIAASAALSLAEIPPGALLPCILITLDRKRPD